MKIIKGTLWTAKIGVFVTLMHHECSFIRTLVSKTKFVIWAYKTLKRRWGPEWGRLIRIPLLSFIMIKSALLTSFALLGLPPLFLDLLLLLNSFPVLTIKLLFLIVDITGISFVLKWMIEAFERWVRLFAFKTQGTAGFIKGQRCGTALAQTLSCTYIVVVVRLVISSNLAVLGMMRSQFAIIRCVKILVWGTPIVLKLVCVDTGHEVMPQVLLRAVGRLIAIHVECVFI